MQKSKYDIPLISILFNWFFVFILVYFLKKQSLVFRNLDVLMFFTLPVIFLIIEGENLKKIFLSLITCLSMVLLVFFIIRDSYHEHEFFHFQLKVTSIFLTFVLYFLLSSKKTDYHHSFIAILITLILTNFTGGILEGLFISIPEFDWDVYFAPFFGTFYFLLIKETKLKTLIQAVSIIEFKTFLSKFLYFSLTTTWAFVVFKLNLGHLKLQFFLTLILLGGVIEKKYRWYLIFLNAVVLFDVIKTSQLMNYEVSYAFLIFAGVATLLHLVSSQIQPIFIRNLTLVLAPLVLLMSFFGSFHIYRLNLRASKQSLITIATRLGMFNKGKIVPIQNEISKEGKELFGGVLFTLIRFHPLSGYQDIFEPDLNAVFGNSRPMYTDETYDKFRNRMLNVMARLNIHWNVDNSSSRYMGKQVNISSVDIGSRFTNVEGEHYMTNSLDFSFPMDNGKYLKSRLEVDSGSVLLSIGEDVIQNLSFKDFVEKQIPAEIKGPALNVELQPSELTRTVEIPGFRIKVKIERIILRKEVGRLQFQQLSGKVFLKKMSAK